MNLYSYIVDGTWGDWNSWSSWSDCSAACGGGKKERRRQRQCDSPKPSNGGNDCEGDGTEEDTEICNTNACPGE